MPSGRNAPTIRTGRHTLWATPAPTHGPTLLAAVAAATPGDDPATQYRRVLAAIAQQRDVLADPSGTSIVSAADRDGNAVVVVHSNSYPRYGSGLVVADYDLVLANRAGRGFNPDPGHANFPIAGSASGDDTPRLDDQPTSRGRRSSGARRAATTRCPGTPNCSRASSTARQHRECS